MADQPAAPEINQEELYGEFLAGERRKRKKRDWKDRLFKRTAHKSLNVADDDDEPMDIKVNKGIGFKELLLIGALMIGSGGVAAWMAGSKVPPAIEKPTPDKQENADSDTLFNLEFAEPKEP